MDKLRALQYFIAAAQERSFTGAARRLDVTVPAIAKMVSALERQIGVSLFGRSARGLTLTTEGESYFETCLPLLAALAAADESLSSATTRPRGTLVVGAPSFLGQHCILPALPRFRARYPDIHLDLRVVNRVTDVEATAVDIFVLAGWSEPGELIHRRLAQTRLLICAAPDYWSAHGIPTRPKELARHPCLLFRNPEGTVLDLWKYERGDEVETVAVSGWLSSNHRDVVLDAVLAGEGIARMTDLSIRRYLHSGQLIPVLLDWESRDAPPVNLLFRPNHRRTPRVRVFVDFLTALFRELEAEREERFAVRLSTEAPSWHRRPHGRASTTASPTE